MDTARDRWLSALALILAGVAILAVCANPPPPQPHRYAPPAVWQAQQR